LADPGTRRLALGYGWARSVCHPKNVLPITP
jgi:hypothetical protein